MRRLLPSPGDKWHMHEVAPKVASKANYLRRADLRLSLTPPCPLTSACISTVGFTRLLATLSSVPVQCGRRIRCAVGGLDA